MTIRVFYIMGAAYSGSTILGALLGSHPDVECVGELARWTLYPDEADRRCACGALVRDCVYWRLVSQACQATSPGGWQPTYARLQRRYERLRSVPLIVLGERVRSAGLEAYRQRSRSVLDAIGTTSGKSIVVDTSKDPARGLALSMLEGVDVRFVHLVRDGMAYLASRMKRRVRQAGRPLGPGAMTLQWLYSSMEWALANRASEEVIRLSGRPWARLQYETLTQDVAGSLGSLSAALGIDLSAVSQGASRGDKIAFGHMLAGNEIRLQGPTSILADLPKGWPLPRLAGMVFGLVAGRSARRYDYGSDSIAPRSRGRTHGRVAS